MQTFKTIVVVGTLLCVGFGAHVIMNKPISNQPLEIADRVWDDLKMAKPGVDLGPDVNTLVPDLPPLGSTEDSVAGGPTVTMPASSAAPATTTAPAMNAQALNAPPMSAPLSPLPEPTNSPLTPDSAVSSSVASDSSMTAPSQFAQPVPTATSTPPELAATPSTQETADESGYGAAATSAVSPAQEYSSTWSNGFEEMWDSVQVKLQSSQFVDALLAVSLFYNDEQLTSEQRDRMITLLDQLAGTVIYSADYHMESAYIVQPNETLAAIATKYNVPETLLARINGLNSPDLQPGTELKVLRGPFRGELNVDTRELTLFLGRYYAGRFSVGVGRDLPAQVANLEVSEIGGAKAFVDRRTGQEVAAGAAENPYGAYWIGLHDPNMPEFTFLGIHSTGAAVDASDTRGCISVSEEDATDLQAILSAGSKIALVR